MEEHTQFDAGNLLINGITNVRIRKANVRKEKRVASQGIEMRKDMEELDHQEIRMQLEQESLKLSFLIP